MENKNRNNHAMVKPSIILVAFWVMVSFSACDIINPEEEIPAYLEVTEFQLNTNNVTEGSNADKITEAWVSVNGNFVGAFPLPARIPVLASGNSTITVEAGIKENGIVSTPNIYPFYKEYVVEKELAPNVTETINPVIRYREETKFTLVEGFEVEEHAFRNIRIGDPDRGIQLTDEEVFEGDYSGKIVLDTSQAIVEIATNKTFGDLSASQPFVYLEVNYKSDVPVVFGLIGFSGSVFDEGTAAYDPGFLPSNNWNKIYFNLTPLFVSGVFEEYQLVLQTAIPVENGDFTTERAEIYLDNIKLVHY